jgi:hypothetical protein
MDVNFGKRKSRYPNHKKRNRKKATKKGGFTAPFFLKLNLNYEKI